MRIVTNGEDPAEPDGELHEAADPLITVKMHALRLLLPQTKDLR